MIINYCDDIKSGMLKAARKAGCLQVLVMDEGKKQEDGRSKRMSAHQQKEKYTHYHTGWFS